MFDADTSYQTEYWLSRGELSSVEYSSYWNDEDHEKDKPWNVLDGDFPKMERYIEETGLIKQLDQCIRLLNDRFGFQLCGVGADLACGNLWAASYLFRTGGVRKLYCVEYSAHRLLKIGPRVLQKYGVPRDKVVMCLGSFYTLKLPDSSLDFVLLSEALHHADRPLDLLAEIRRVLKPEGAVLIIGEPKRTKLDIVKHLVKFLISRSLSPRVQNRLFGRTFDVRMAVLKGWVLVDPVLGDHSCSNREYSRLFATAGFNSYHVRTRGAGIHGYVLRPRVRGAERSWRRRLQPVAARFGITSTAVFWRGLALRAYQRKLRTNAAFRQWRDTEAHRWVPQHWGHEVVEGEFEQLHLAWQLYELTETLRQRVGDVGNARVLDAGASDGFFLARLGAKRGVGLNFLEKCAQKIRADGFPACLGDLEELPFGDKAFDYVICCETIEHVCNPVQALNELARVCARRIYLTIPWLPRTRVNNRPPGWPEVESHVFEFSESDFAKVLSHTRLRVVYRDRVQVFPEPRNPLTQWWLKQWMYPSFFPKLQYYELEPLP